MVDLHHYITTSLTLNPLDIVIGAVTFLAGRYLFKSNRALGLFFQVSLLLIRITKHYFDTHPEARKIAHQYHTEVDKVYHEHLSIAAKPGRKTVG